MPSRKRGTILKPLKSAGQGAEDLAWSERPRRSELRDNTQLKGYISAAEPRLIHRR